MGGKYFTDTDQNTQTDQCRHHRNAGAPHMTYYDRNMDSRPGDWFVDTARRNPEALLVLAAGAALLMRGGSRSRSRVMAADYSSFSRDDREDRPDAYYGGGEEESYQSSRGGGLREKIGGAAAKAGEFTSGIGTQVAETSRSYAATVGQYAETGRRRVARQAYRARRHAGQTLHEQPLLVASLGLAAGAAIAAMLPRVEIEERALRPARDALGDAANRAAASLREAATDAGRRLQEGAADLGAAALKEAAQGAVRNFSEGPSSASGASARQRLETMAGAGLGGDGNTAAGPGRPGSVNGS
jgi:hypothetical protein